MSPKRKISNQSLENNRKRKQRQRNKDKADVEQQLEKKIQSTTYCTLQEKIDTINDFENHCKNITVHHCKICHEAGINLKWTNKHDRCSKCIKKTEQHYIENNLMPIWNDGKNIRFDVPKELKCLSEAEKMLIQRLSPFVPLHHIRNGTLGIKGHVCCFPQDIGNLCNELPRLPQDVEVVKINKSFQEEIGGKAKNKNFLVNKTRVLTALRWLKKYHIGYHDINIIPENLNWCNSEESELPSKSQSDTIIENDDTITHEDDEGPAPKQISNIKSTFDCNTVVGVVDENQFPMPSEEDLRIYRCLKKNGKSIRK